jgi:chitinase
MNTSLIYFYLQITQDFFGAWDNVTGVDSPLYPQGFGSDEFSIDRCVQNYMDLGVPKEKLHIGLPFYGRSFKHATGLNQPHGGNDVASWPDDDGTPQVRATMISQANYLYTVVPYLILNATIPQYFNIYAKLPQMIQVRDNKSKTQYAYTSRLEQPGLQLPEGLVSFDDERAICDKVHYAQTHDLGGFIIWELCEFCMTLWYHVRLHYS